MLDREVIIKLLEDNGQNPIVVKSKLFLPNTNTIIETKSKGAFYILEYCSDGRVGWSISFSKLHQLKSSYNKNYVVILLNAKDGEIFIVLGHDLAFYSTLNVQNGSYRVERSDVCNPNANPKIDRSISQENLDEYLGS